ncbi:DUF1848 domain-containing protein [Caloramator sp.]|uniref:DUF1848 domain-containing protein n=1 Tax=Caloramator sp. TaxID=1871330 RepID=UPI00345A9F0F
MIFLILSVSRRTDIPAFYSEWFLNRMKEGYVYVKNPFNAKQISKINIRPDVVDCIVFWTKDSKPLMNYLDELKDYKYYFQFTITPYKKDIEPNLRNKSEIVDTFIELSKRIGKEKVILRYDPILLTDKYTLNYHKAAFSKLCQRVSGYTDKVIISFLDDYKKVSRNMKGIELKEMTEEDIYEISDYFSNVAGGYGLKIETCGEEIDLSKFGIEHGRCVDGELIEKIVGYKLKNLKRDGNRSACLCHECIDIGQYDTCAHGCLYCYANINKPKAEENYRAHNPKSPLLFGEYEEEYVTERKDVKSFRVEEVEQIRLI